MTTVLCIPGAVSGTVSAYVWQRTYGPTSHIDPARLQFVLCGNSIRPKTSAIGRPMNAYLAALNNAAHPRHTQAVSIAWAAAANMLAVLALTLAICVATGIIR